MVNYILISLIKEYLKPSQKEIIDKVLRNKAQEIFIDMCEKNLICPLCGEKLFISPLNTEQKQCINKSCKYKNPPNNFV